MEREFNLVVVGAPFVGKTSFITKFATKCEDSLEYAPVYTCKFRTINGDIAFRIYEGNSMGDIYGDHTIKDGVHALIIMASNDEPRSFSSAHREMEQMWMQFGIVPTVMVVNKCDLTNNNLTVPLDFMYDFFADSEAFKVPILGTEIENADKRMILVHLIDCLIGNPNQSVFWREIELVHDLEESQN